MTSPKTSEKIVMNFDASSDVGRNVVAASYSKGLIFWILVKLLSDSVGCLASCESKSLGSSSSGQFNLSTYAGYLVDDICRWTLEPTFQDYVILIDFKEIDLSTKENELTSRCAASLFINGERFYCHRKEPFCVTYATSDKCSDALSDYPLCLRRNQTIPKLELEFDAYLYDENSQKFKADYKVLECDYKPATTRQDPQTLHDIGRMHDRSKDAEKTPPPIASTTSNTKEPDNIELIVILLPIAIAVLVASMMGMWCRCRRMKSRQQDENSDYNSFGATKDTMANVAYESWNPPSDNRPELPERTHGVTRNLTIPGVSIRDDEYSDFNNIYEAIPPPPPSIITPRFSELGQRYFEVGFSGLNIDVADQPRNVYERGDANMIENQSPYDMAISNPDEFAA